MVPANVFTEATNETWTTAASLPEKRALKAVIEAVRPLRTLRATAPENVDIEAVRKTRLNLVASAPDIVAIAEVKARRTDKTIAPEKVAIEPVTACLKRRAVAIAPENVDMEAVKACVDGLTGNRNFGIGVVCVQVDR